MYNDNLFSLVDCSAQVSANLPSTPTNNVAAISAPYGSLFVGENIGCTNSGAAALDAGLTDDTFSVVMWVNVFDTASTQYLFGKYKYIAPGTIDERLAIILDGSSISVSLSDAASASVAGSTSTVVLPGTNTITSNIHYF